MSASLGIDATQQLQSPAAEGTDTPLLRRAALLFMVWWCAFVVRQMSETARNRAITSEASFAANTLGTKYGAGEPPTIRKVRPPEGKGGVSHMGIDCLLRVQSCHTGGRWRLWQMMACAHGACPLRTVACLGLVGLLTPCRLVGAGDPRGAHAGIPDEQEVHRERKQSRLSEREDAWRSCAAQEVRTDGA